MSETTAQSVRGLCGLEAAGECKLPGSKGEQTYLVREESCEWAKAMTVLTSAVRTPARTDAAPPAMLEGAGTGRGESLPDCDTKVLQVGYEREDEGRGLAGGGRDVGAETDGGMERCMECERLAVVLEERMKVCERHLEALRGEEARGRESERRLQEQELRLEEAMAEERRLQGQERRLQEAVEKLRKVAELDKLRKEALPRGAGIQVLQVQCDGGWLRKVLWVWGVSVLSFECFEDIAKCGSTTLSGHTVRTKGVVVAGRCQPVPSSNQGSTHGERRHGGGDGESGVLQEVPEISAAATGS